MKNDLTSAAAERTVVAQPKLRRRPFQYSLRTLLLVTGVVAGVMGWFAYQRNRFENELAVSATLEKLSSGIDLGGFRAEDGFPYDKPAWNVGELWRGRLYRPITSAWIQGATLDDAAWSRLTSLRYLDDLTITECVIESSAGIDLSRCARLESLNIVGTVFSSPPRIESLRQCTRLNSLAMCSEAGVTNDDLKSIGELTNLEHLYLSGALISDRGLANLVQLGKLRSLSLAGTLISPDAIQHLLPLKEQLRALYLRDTKIDDASLALLGEFPNLCELDLSNTRVTDAGVASLSVGKLYELWLDDTDVTDASVETLARNADKLKHLYMSGTYVTDKAVPLLVEMPSLANVMVERTGVSDAGRQALLDQVSE